LSAQGTWESNVGFRGAKGDTPDRSADSVPHPQAARQSAPGVIYKIISLPFRAGPSSVANEPARKFFLPILVVNVFPKKVNPLDLSA
jgi:hypothetical protein